MLQNPPPPRPSHAVRWLISVVGSVLKLFAWLVPQRRSVAYVPNKSDEKLEEQARRELAFLFDEYSASVASNVKYRTFGSAELTIEAANVALQIFKDGRDQELRVLTAPRLGNWTWERLGVVLAASVTTEDPKKLRYWGSYDQDPSKALAELANLLRPRFQQLNEALSRENYPSTEVRLMGARRYLVT